MSSQYQKVSQDDPPTLPPPSGKESRVNTGFAKAAIVLNHRLEGIRGKRVSFSSSNSNPTTPKSNMTTGKPAVVVRVEEVAEKDAGQAEPELDPEIKKEQAKIDKSIRILRAVQGTVTGFLSLMIAIFQGRAYVNYLNTKDVPGAWPKTPSLAPTIMLFSVAIAAIVFDLALLVAYFFPRAKIAKYALVVAIKAHWVITSAKTVSYLLTAVACRAGFDQGNASGNNNDLWSWTCSDKAKPMEATNNCDANCTMQVSLDNSPSLDINASASSVAFCSR